MKKIFVVLASALVVTGAYAQGAASETPGTPSTATTTRHAAKKAPRSAVDRVEKQIKDLHSQLEITPAQEDKWNTVAQTMRDNASQIDALVATRTDKIDSYNAPDDLKSYGDIAAAHADGIKKLVTVFQPLYDSMPDSQKKLADEAFHRPRRAQHARHGTHKKAAPAAPATQQ